MVEETEIRMDVAPGVEVYIDHIGGDLSLEGVDESAIEVNGEEAHLLTEDGGARARIKAGGDCVVHVPIGARVEINEIGGDAEIKNLESELQINETRGDLVVRDVTGHVTIGDIGGDARITDTGGVEIKDVGSDLVIRDINGEVQIRNVGSDLEMKRINGEVQVRNIGSDATFREINGSVEINNVGSDLVINDVNGSCTVDNVGSDVVLDVDFSAPFEYKIERVGSDVLAKIGPDARVRFIIPSKAEKSINVRGARIETGDDEDTIIIGDEGETPFSEVHISSIGSELQLVAQSKSKSGFSGMFERLRDMIPENLEEIIATRINEALPRIQESMNRQLERLQREAERIRAQAEREAERVRAQAEREAERARAQAERMRERAERGEKQKHKGRRAWAFSAEFPGFSHPPHPPQPPPPPRAQRPVEPVTEQERLAILRMVENKQITIEEAERLLAALEGRD